MEQEQMTLFAVDMTPRLVSSDETSDKRHPFDVARDAVTAYGTRQGQCGADNDVICERIFGFVSGLTAIYRFDTDQQEYLRNLAWMAADIETMKQQN